ncbi:PAS domain S-box protein [Thalassobaculum sp. OXR-137]|uniref:PAS domain S-box protein n=1 Tax=Thalassobaculum sp. OXR-137 TaxID=3100173 RepID=UPI002AC9EB98|nr:PAS domain S-box protein [Thalassobaculum sp. OXR-137]WPZ35873.1 PAS domain S-box protein [Thalassobaculum sp. OXR-137]
MLDHEICTNILLYSDLQVFIANTQGKILDANPAACRALGYSNEEIKKLYVYEIDANHSEAQWHHSLEQLRVRKTAHFISKHIDKDGNIIDVDVNTTLIISNQKEIICGIVSDISEKMRLEEELNISRRTYQTAINTTDLGFWVVNGEADIIQTNSAYCKLSGYSSDEMTSMKVSDLDDLEEEREVRRKIDLIMNTGYARFRTVHRKKEGGKLPVEVVISYSDQFPDRFFVFIQDISEKIEQEHRLEEAVRAGNSYRKQLDMALNSINEGFALFDKDDRLVLCNNVYRDFYNSRGEVIVVGRTLTEINRRAVELGLFPEARGREEEWLADRTRKHLECQVVEQEIANGRWLKISEQRTQDGGIVGVRTDITDLKNREKSLRESEQRFKDFTDTASDWIWETDVDHRFSYTENGHRAPENFAQSLIYMKTREEVAAEDTNSPKWVEHRRLLADRKPFRDFRYWTIAPNNTQRLIAVSGNPVFNELNEFQGYRGTGADVTDEHLTLEKLNDAEAMLRRMFENVTIGLIHADATGKIIDFNAAAEKIFGYSAQEAIGCNVSMLVNDHDRVRHDSYMKRYLDTGDAKIIGIGRETFGKRKDGTSVRINLGIAEIPSGDERHFIASMLDVTNERALEAKLRQSQKMDAIGQMVGGVAHDFNNLLGIISGNLELVQRKLEPESKLERQIGKALTAAGRGANLTRRLLNFSRQMPSEAAAIDVNETITELHDLIQKSLTETVKVHLRLEEDLPDANAERGDFEDAITNLCINARDAMPEGGQIIIETGLIEVPAQPSPQFKGLRPGRYIEIDISDTGTGMSADVAAHIFEPFFSTKEQGRGTGLGLSMVYGFAKRSNGSVSVYSEQGIGTTFKLFLPVATADGVSSSNSAAAPAAADEDYSGNESILIVDDEQELADIAVTILSELGYRTAVAHNAEEALAILRSDWDIDLLFTDVIMPGGIDGFALAKRARQMRPELEICLASGFTGASINTRVNSEEEYLLLKKPYTNADLATTVRRLLDARTLSK